MKACLTNSRFTPFVCLFTFCALLLPSISMAVTANKRLGTHDILEEVVDEISSGFIARCLEGGTARVKVIKQGERYRFKGENFVYAYEGVASSLDEAMIKACKGTVDNKTIDG